MIHHLSLLLFLTLLTPPTVHDPLLILLILSLFPPTMSLHKTKIEKEVVIPFTNQHCVFVAVLPAIILQNAHPPMPAVPNIPSSVTGVTTNWPTNPTNQSVSCSMSGDHALTLLPVHMVTIPVLSVVTNIMQPPHVPETKFSRILHKTITPYNPVSWQCVLNECNLLSCYPNLVCDIKYGSPISNPPCLSETFIPNNLASLLNTANFVFSSLAEEAASGRMDGPFSIAEAQTIFEGHF